MRFGGFPCVEIPNVRHASLFVSVAETGSITAAAERTNISQPAASQAIASLENLFGGPLLDRTGGNLCLTERGHIVFTRFSRGLEFLASCDEVTRPQNREHRQRFNSFTKYASSANLRAIVAVALTGSFTAAAITLGRSEPAINKSIRKLEAALELRLFDQHPSGTLPTQIGKVFARLSGQAIKEFSSAIDETSELDGQFEGIVSIGASPVARSRILPDAVTQLLNRHRRARFVIHDGSQSDLISELQFGSVDIVVGSMEEVDLRSGLDSRVIFTDQLAIAASANHPLSGEESFRPDRLLDFPWILPPKGTATRRVMERAWEEAGLAMPARGTIETDSMEVVRALLMTSDCLTVLSEPHLSQVMDPSRIRGLSFLLAGGQRKIGLITRKRWRPTRLQSEFIDLLESAQSRSFQNAKT